MRTVVLMLTDVVGSTRLWAAERAAMDAAMARHHEIVHGLVAEHAGWRPVDQGEGDAVFAAFDSPTSALECAAGVQRALAAEPWPTSVPLTVRVGVHLGEVTERDGNLFGDPVNRCARLRGLGAGGQVLLSSAVHETVRDSLPAGLGVVDLGEHRMKDLSRPERVWQLAGDGLDGPFPALASLDRTRHNLPVQLSSFVGREKDLAELVALVREHRLVTITGFGGMGKTRLALQAAAELADGSVGDVWFVDLVSVADPTQVPGRVAEVLGIRNDGSDPARALVAGLRETPTLLVLDNLEQVLGCAAFVADLLAQAPAVRLLATSREPLRVRGEYQVALPPLSLPTTPVASGSLSAYAAVRLFLDRAVAVRPDFTVDNRTAPAVAAVCAKLDGHPLALELAAARLKMLSIEQLLARLESALSVLTGGSRDMPERHQTLRATIAWSFDSLSGDEKLLLTRMSVLPAPASFEMVEDVCGQDLDVLDLLASLVDKSLVTVTELDGRSRYGLLVSIREYAVVQLDPATLGNLRDRHAHHVHTALASHDGLLAEGAEEKIAYVGRELAHVRTAVDQRRQSGPPGALAALVVAIDDALVHRGLVRESLELTRAALLDTGDPDLVCHLRMIEVTAFRSPPPQLVVSLIEAIRRCTDLSVRANALVMALFDPQTRVQFDELALEVDRAIEQMPSNQAPFLRAQSQAAAASVLRFVDPEAAESAARHADVTQMNAGLRLTFLLLDRGEWEEALSVLSSLSDVSTPWLAASVDATAASALAHAGRLDEARNRVSSALEGESDTGEPHVFTSVPLVDLERAAGHPEAALKAAEGFLAALPGDARSCGLRVSADEDWHVVSLRWRRAVCLRQLGHLEQAAAELAVCREYFVASELFGPRELLGILVERAVQVADEDPARAAALLGSVRAHRGRWVLPFGMDADREQLLTRLPEPVGPPLHPAQAW